jgi:hypothetical protein
MSEISASMSDHSRSLIGDIFFKPIFLILFFVRWRKRQYLQSIMFRDSSKQAVKIKRLLLAPSSRVSHDRSTNRLWYLRWLDRDLPCYPSPRRARLGRDLEKRITSPIFSLFYSREVSQTAGQFRWVRLFRLLRLAGVRFWLNRLATEDTVKPVQNTIGLVIERASKHEAIWFVRGGVAPEY